MSAMETTFTVRTDTDNDALQVPDGIETVVVNENAERVFVPANVQIIRLQTARGGGGGGGGGGGQRARSRSRSPEGRKQSIDRYGDMIDELVRAKRSVGTDMETESSTRAPAVTQKSLSLPSCPPTPPGSRSAGTDVPDFRAAERPPPTAVSIAMAERADAPVSLPASPSAPAGTLERQSAPAPVSMPMPVPVDIFSDRTLEVDRTARVINQQPTQTAVGNGRVVRYAGETEAEMRDPLVRDGTLKMRKLDSFGWREEFERGEKENKPTIQKFGRAVADIMCCWLGV